MYIYLPWVPLKSEKFPEGSFVWYSQELAKQCQFLCNIVYYSDIMRSIIAPLLATLIIRALMTSRVTFVWLVKVGRTVETCYFLWHICIWCFICSIVGSTWGSFKWANLKGRKAKIQSNGIFSRPLADVKWLKELRNNC